MVQLVTTPAKTPVCVCTEPSPNLLTQPNIAHSSATTYWITKWAEIIVCGVEGERGEETPDSPANARSYRSHCLSTSGAQIIMEIHLARRYTAAHCSVARLEAVINYYAVLYLLNNPLRLLPYFFAALRQWIKADYLSKGHWLLLKLMKLNKPGQLYHQTAALSSLKPLQRGAVKLCSVTRGRPD